MKKLLSFFQKDIKIRNRLILSNLILIVVPITIVTLLFGGRFLTMIRDNVLVEQKLSSLQVSSQTDSIVTQITSVCDAAYNDSNLSRFLTVTDEGWETFLGDPATYDALESYQGILRSNLVENVKSIKIYSDAPVNLLNAPFGGERDELFAPLSHIEGSPWQSAFFSLPGNLLYAPRQLLNSWEQQDCGEIAIVRRFRYFQGDILKESYIAVYQSAEAIEQSLRDGMSGSRGIAYLIDSQNNLVATSQLDPSEPLPWYLSYEEAEQSLDTQGEFRLVELNGEELYASCREIPHSGWRLVWMIPRSDILEDSRSLAFQFVGSYAALMVLAMLIGVLLSGTIITRIHSLKRQMESVKSEHPAPLPGDPGKDEIGDLIATYNYMAGRINTLIQDRLSTAEELNKVKIEALRAQIDPHFLYNTLDMINWYAKNGKNQEVSDAVLALSRFYRLTLNKGNLMGRVRDELEHVTLYVQLMNMRSGNRIDFLVDVPDEMMEYKIPMIIFQPIVENAIQHGIFEKPTQEGTVTLTGWMEEGSLHFLVSDDGVGMEEKQVSTLLTEKSGIGVYNTNRRLQICYPGTDAGLRFSSQKYLGTEVEFCIPTSEADSSGEFQTEEPL